MKYFSADSPLRNPQEVRWGEEAGRVQGQPGARGQRDKIQNGQKGDKSFEDKGGTGV